MSVIDSAPRPMQSRPEVKPEIVGVLLDLMEFDAAPEEINTLTGLLNGTPPHGDPVDEELRWGMARARDYEASGVPTNPRHLRLVEVLRQLRGSLTYVD